MKRAVKVLLGTAAAGALASAAALAAKKYRDSRKKHICTECGDEDFYGNDEDEFSLIPGEENELISAGDYDSGSITDGCYLTEAEVSFVRYMLDGIKNTGAIMNYTMEDIKKLIRRRNISNADKLSGIRALCSQDADNYGLMKNCIGDISDMLGGCRPEDFWDYYAETYMKEGDKDAE